jgi:hypothetical protein
MRLGVGPGTMVAVTAGSGEEGDAGLRAGDHVRLSRSIGHIVGFIRRESAVVVIKFDRSSDLVRVDPAEIERLG